MTLHNIWAIVCMLLFFGGSIFVHEFGHFLAAKRRKLKVPRFSIGFGPKIFSWTRGETEYCISLLPLGGYVALPQMGETPVLEGQSNIEVDKSLSFYDKFIVAVMGAVFNVLFAFVLAVILWAVGLPVSDSEKTTTVGYVLPSIEDGDNKIEGPAFKAGLQAGDRILKVDGTTVNGFSDINKAIVLGVGQTSDGKPQVNLTIQREKEKLDLTVYPQKIAFNVVSKDNMRCIGILPAQSMVIGTILPESPAAKVGLKTGDRLLSVNNVPLYSLVALQAHLDATKGEKIILGIERDGKPMKVEIIPEKSAYQKPWIKVSFIGDKQQSLELYPEYLTQPKEGISTATPCKLKVLDKEGAIFEAFNYDSQCVGINNKRLQSLDDVRSELSLPASVYVWEVKDSKSEKSHFIALPSKNLAYELKDALYLYRLGIQIEYKEILTHPTPVEQFHRSFSTTFETLSKLVNRHSDVKIKNLMGPPGIMRLLHHFSSNDFRRLLWFTILLNINLAVLNLLPIPILDGGHILFAAIERFRGKPIPVQWLNWIQTAFVFLFLGLMVYVSFFDIRRWQGDRKVEAAIEKQEKLSLPFAFEK